MDKRLHMIDFDIEKQIYQEKYPDLQKNLDAGIKEMQEINASPSLYIATKHTIEVIGKWFKLPFQDKKDINQKLEEKLDKIIDMLAAISKKQAYVEPFKIVTYRGLPVLPWGSPAHYDLINGATPGIALETWKNTIDDFLHLHDGTIMVVHVHKDPPNLPYWRIYGLFKAE